MENKDLNFACYSIKTVIFMFSMFIICSCTIVEDICMYIHIHIYIYIKTMIIIIKDVRTKRENFVIYYGRDEVFSPFLVIQLTLE